MPGALQQLLFFPLAAPYHAAYHPQLSILRNNNLPRANEDSRTSRRRCPRSRGSRGGAPGPGVVWQLCFWGLGCKQARQIFNSQALTAVSPSCPSCVCVCASVCVEAATTHIHTLRYPLALANFSPARSLRLRCRLFVAAVELKALACYTL